MSAALATTRRAGLLGVGYEGRSIDEFVESLVDQGVTCVVDVRMTPISRKRGFSKSALRQALAAVGIRYEHHRELGNPKDNRPGFAGSTEELASARAAYAALLDSAEPQSVLDRLAKAAPTELIALLCFEADESRCHRGVILDAIRDWSTTASASTRRAH